MSALYEHLARQFQAWEVRGRGWQVHPFPVLLEPPFRPFLGYIPLPGTGRDDGRKLSLAQSLWSAVRGKQEDPPPESVEFDEPEAELDPEGAQVVELQIKLPVQVDITPELSEQLLHNLLASQSRIGFELLGLGPDVVLQFVVPRTHTGDLRSAIETYVPDVCVAQQETLRTAWETNESDETVLIDFGLSNEFLLPLATRSSFRIDPLLGFLSTLEALGVAEESVRVSYFAGFVFRSG